MSRPLWTKTDIWYQVSKICLPYTPLTVSILNTTLLQSMANSWSARPSTAMRPPCAMLSIMSRIALGWPDISNATSKPSVMPSSSCTWLNVVLRTSTAPRHAALRRELEPVVADVGDDDESRAVVARDLRGHDADRAGAGDQHVLGDDAELRRGVHGVAERIEDRGDVQVDLRQVRPEVTGRHHDELGESTVPLHTDANGVGTQRAAAGHAVAALAADDVPFRADDLVRVDVHHVLAQLHDFADELVADHQGWIDGVLRPLVPAVDVKIGAADAGPQDADQHLAGTRLRLRHVLEPQARFPLRFDQGLH